MKHAHTMLLAFVFVVIFILVGWDLSSDYAGGVTRLHVVLESAVLALSGGAAIGLLVFVLRARRRLERLNSDLACAREESVRWRAQYADLVRGLASGMQEQFRRWQLSGAESEVALLLLKGLSLKEIARARGVTERTAREQARAVYRKAGLAGRSDLAAFFLEDLLHVEGDSGADAGRLTDAG